MGGITPAKFIGVGVIWNCTDNVELSNQAEMGFDFPIDVLEVPAGDTYSVNVIEKQQRLTGRFGFRDLYSALLAAQIGGTTATGAVKHISQEEVVIATGTPPTATLAQQPYTVDSNLAAIRVIDSNGNVYKQVSGSPAAEFEFEDTGAGKILNFYTGTDGRTIYVSYFWDDATNGITVKMDPSTMPGHKAYMFAGVLYSTDTGEEIGYLVSILKKVARRSGLNSAPGVGDAATIGFDWEATVTTASDAWFCFPKE
jgi:hypothetical protein